MRAWLIIGLLALGVAQSVPKKANKPDTNQGTGKNIPSQSAKSAAESNPPLVGPPQKEENGADTEAKQASWGEKILTPLVANWPLVAVAIWGIIVAIRTLETIKEQTEATRKAADAAKTSADALIASERAWIMVDIVPPPGWGEKVRGIVGDHIANGIHTQTTSVALRILSRNEGKAPAWITEKRVCVEIRSASLPPVPDLDSIQERNYEPQSVAVGKEAVPSWDITPSCDGHEETGQMIVIYGVIVYRDPFSDGHTTTFGYRITPDGQLRRLEGLLKYNENT